MSLFEDVHGTYHGAPAIAALLGVLALQGGMPLESPVALLLGLVVLVGMSGGQ
ncbi:MAG: hypothetical protein ABIG96_04505 [Candidatus Micrarchaeota archaeon]